MARVQVDPLRTPELRPAAAPVDSFANPNAGAQLGQLADALKGIAPELAQFSGTIARQNIERDTTKGRAEADRLFAEVQESGRQIKAGEIAPSESKYFRAAANEQLGRLHAGKFATNVTALLADPAGPLSESTDLADFDAAVSAARKDYVAQLGGQDVSFMSGFDAIANQQVIGARDQFARVAGDRLEKQVIEATYQEHQRTIEGGITSGLSLEQIGAMIYERNTIQYALNPKSGAALSQTMIRAVIDTAIKTENLDVLDLLKHIPGGRGNGTLANTSVANRLVPEAIKEIRGMRQQRYNLINAEDAAQTEEAVEGVLGSLYEAMDAAHQSGASMTTVNPQPFADEMSKTDPTKAALIYRAYAAYQNRVNVDDEATAFDLRNRSNRDILTQEAVADAFQGKLITWETARELRQDIAKSKGGRRRTFLTEDPRMNESKSRLFQRFIDQYGINTPGAKTRAEFAVQELETAWIKWREGEGRNASELEVNDWLHATHNALFMARADTALQRNSLKGVELPAPGSVGPQLVDWQKGAVVDASVVAMLDAELQKLRTTPSYKLSPRAEAVLVANGIRNKEELQKFIDRQRQFIPRNP